MQRSKQTNKNRNKNEDRENRCELILYINLNN